MAKLLWVKGPTPQTQNEQYKFNGVWVIPVTSVATIVLAYYTTVPNPDVNREIFTSCRQNIQPL